MSLVSGWTGKDALGAALLFALVVSWLLLVAGCLTHKGATRLSQTLMKWGANIFVVAILGGSVSIFLLERDPIYGLRVAILASVVAAVYVLQYIFKRWKRK